MRKISQRKNLLLHNVKQNWMWNDFVRKQKTLPKIIIGHCTCFCSIFFCRLVSFFSFRSKHQTILHSPFIFIYLSVFCFSLSNSLYVCWSLSVRISKFLVNLYSASNFSDNRTRSLVASWIGTSDMYSPFLKTERREKRITNKICEQKKKSSFLHQNCSRDIYVYSKR